MNGRHIVVLCPQQVGAELVEGGAGDGLGGVRVRDGGVASPQGVLVGRTCSLTFKNMVLLNYPFG